MDNNKVKSNVRVVSLGHYNQPKVKEVTFKEWITFGDNNSYFDYLIETSRTSVTNGACISSISNLTYGKGLNAHDKARKPNEWAQFLSLFKPNDVRKIVDDLKRLGQTAIQCQWQGNHKTIKTATHFPVQNLAIDKELKDGEIQGYYYAPDWEKVRTIADLTRISALGKSKDANEILIIRPYQAGLFWFGLPDNFAGLPWSDLEGGIAAYHNSAIKRSFAPSMFVSLNNGMPQSETEASAIVDKMRDEYQDPTKAGGVIFSFAVDKEHETTITPVALSDLPQQYEFLSKEASFKILSSHKVPSPALLGIPVASGFSSTADELTIASVILETYVLNPLRTLLIEGFNKILTINGITLDIFFDSLNPFEKEENVDVDMTKLSSDVDDLVDYEFKNILLNLTENETDLELIKEREWSAENTNEWVSGLEDFTLKYKWVGHGKCESKFCNEMTRLSEKGVVYDFEEVNRASYRGKNNTANHEGKSYSLLKYRGGNKCDHFFKEQVYKQSELDTLLESYALEAPEGYELYDGEIDETELSVIQDSKQDTKLWKIRYEYVIGTSKSHDGKKSRAFCTKMISLAKSGRLFRKEDIDKMSAAGVNGEFAHSGGKYDIFLYGGGVNCYHRWERRIFKKRRDEDGEPLGGNAMANTFPVNVNEARRQGAKLPKNDPDVAVAEIDKDDNGRF